MRNNALVILATSRALALHREGVAVKLRAESKQSLDDQKDCVPKAHFPRDLQLSLFPFLISNRGYTQYLKKCEELGIFLSIYA